MKRTAYYIRSTHWDREWYQPFQGYRMRLVSLLDEVLESFAKDPQFKFNMDGQSIPVYDFLEIRPEKIDAVKRFASEGRFKIGPWYVAPDEWLVSGESLIRNLQLGIDMANKLGGASSRAGFAADQFGHISQLPQIFAQLGIGGAYIWRGTNERDHHGHFIWQSPDGTSLPTYRFGQSGYCTLAFRVRDIFEAGRSLVPAEAVDRLVEYTKFEAGRSPISPIFLFDGADHLEIEPKMAEIIAAANLKLEADGIQIISSDLDAYQEQMIAEKSRIEKKIIGELRESGREAGNLDEQWLIAGTMASRIHLKQRNAVCEDELCLWAEPFSTFAAEKLSHEYPTPYLRLAWKHLIENHPHDSMCACSIDEVHQDMIYRFDQSLQISSRLTEQALRATTIAAGPKLPEPKEGTDAALIIGVFNPTAEAIDEPVDLTIAFSEKWSAKFGDFGQEEKFSFKLLGPGGEEIPYQLVHQRKNSNSFHITRYKFPLVEKRHLVSITAKIQVPALGYTTLVAEPATGPTRYLGSMLASHRSIENENLRVTVNPNGSLTVDDKRAKHSFDQLLTFEDQTDNGDGWVHGIPTNEQILSSAASRADVAIIANGLNKATLRIDLTLNVPAAFDLRKMERDSRKTPLRIVSDVTLRKGADRVEVTTTVFNNVFDHRLRVLFPTNLSGEKYWSDGAFDVLERPITLAADNAIRKELQIETRPQITWTAFGDGKTGLAIVSRGLPETAVIDRADRAIALTLLRSFRKAVFADDNLGGEIQGEHVFKYDIVPFAGEVPMKKLFLLGQRVNSPVRQYILHRIEKPTATLPRSQSFATAQGDAIVTSIQRHGSSRLVRLFNPTSHVATVDLGPAKSAKSLTLDDRDETQTKIQTRGGKIQAAIPSKRIASVLLSPV